VVGQSRRVELHYRGRPQRGPLRADYFVGVTFVKDQRLYEGSKNVLVPAEKVPQLGIQIVRNVTKSVAKPSLILCNCQKMGSAFERKQVP
jgi:hypothetical protein